MAVQITVAYEGNLRSTATHGPSKNQVVTDAPVDNQGKGESFSPTDLVATALGTCMLTIMGIVAARHNLDIRGTRVRVEKHMVADPVRRISRLPSTIEIPVKINPEQRQALENAALTCPVHNSLDPRIERPVQFLWSG